MFSVIYITTKNINEARKISGVLLRKKLIACANIFPIESQFWWKGKIEKCSESAIICKTNSKNVEKVIDTVKKNHSYDIPDVVEIPIKSGNKDFLKWIDEVVE
jgi:periplasmic divalent cation tolerance protein